MNAKAQKLENQAILLSAHFAKIDNKYQQLKRQYELARQAVIDYSLEHDTAIVGSAIVSTVTRKGNVSNKLLEAGGIAIDDFRGPDVTYHTVTWSI